MHYSMIIQWSDEDQAFLVTLPEWNPLPIIHGGTYEEALQRGKEVLEGLIASRQQAGQSLPEPKVYATPLL